MTVWKSRPIGSIGYRGRQGRSWRTTRASQLGHTRYDSPKIPRAEARQHVVADRARPHREIVERDVRAEKLCADSGARSVFGQIGHVGDAEIHRHASNEPAATAGNGDFRPF